jgi:prepilin-type N-terminal cleavage/methylation domain-containing protein
MIFQTALHRPQAEQPLQRWATDFANENKMRKSMIFSIFKQPARIAMRFVAGGRSHRSKSGTTAPDIQTAVAPLPKRNRRSLQGFTLVELMVVMAMTAIMIGVTLTSLSGAKDRKAVETEARKFAATVREMQNYALTGKAIDSNGNPTCAVGINVINGGATAFQPRYKYRTGGVASCAAGNTAADFGAVRPLSNGVTFSVGSTGDIYFDVPRGNIDFTSLVNPTRIEFAKSTARYSVCIYPIGRVEEQAGSVACP